MLHVRKAKRIAIGAEIIEKSLLVSHDLGVFCLSDELDHVALLSITLSKYERLKVAFIVAANRTNVSVSLFISFSAAPSRFCLSPRITAVRDVGIRGHKGTSLGQYLLVSKRVLQDKAVWQDL